MVRGRGIEKIEPASSTYSKAFPDMWDTSYAPQKMAEKISYAQNVCSDCPVQQMCAKWYYSPVPEGVIVAGISILE